MKSTFSTIFYLKRQVVKKDGAVPVMECITVDGTQTQNATTSLLDLLDTFSEFVRDAACKDVKNIQQFYDGKRVFNIAGRAGAQVEYDPRKIRDVEFDLSIVPSTATPAYRAMANDFLMQLWQQQAIIGANSSGRQLPVRRRTSAINPISERAVGSRAGAGGSFTSTYGTGTTRRKYGGCESTSRSDAESIKELFLFLCGEKFALAACIKHSGQIFIS